MEKQTNEKKVLIFSTIAVVLLIIVVVGATYAFFTAQGGASANTNVNVQTNTTDNLSFSVGDAISITANQDNFAQDAGNQAGSTTATATLTANNATNQATANYYLYLDITNNDFEYTVADNTPELILTIEAPGGTELTSLSGYKYVTVDEVSGFDITTASDVIKIAENYEITSTGTETQTWNITVTFVNLDTDQVGNTGKTFEATLIIQAEPLQTRVNFTSYITDTLYTADGVNNLYYHDGVGDYVNSDQEAGDNSYRYSGINPNNYVCFGATGETCQNEDNQYRIIGVFNNQVKLIKVTSFGNYAWDVDNVNTWDEITKPDIYTTLNTTYYNTLENEWQNLISETAWQVGGFGNLGTAKETYDVEVGTGQSGYEETMKIGLMYASDYGFAANTEKWTINIGYPDGENYGLDNWLYSDTFDWLISRNSSDSINSHYVDRVYVGRVDGNHGSFAENSIHPAFYLNSDVEIYEGHAGTASDPYRIVL